MKRQSATFAALLIVCCGASFLGGRLAVIRSSKTRHTDRPAFERENEPAVGGESFAARPAREAARIDERLDAVLAGRSSTDWSLFNPDTKFTPADDFPAPIRRTSNDPDGAGSALPTELDGDGPSLGSPSTPEQLPHLDDAAPIDEAQKRRDEQTRAIIADELSDASQEERDVWFDELKGLDPNMTRELLRLRKIIRHDSPNGFTDLPTLPTMPGLVQTEPLRDIPSELISRPSYGDGSVPSAMPAVESSIAALRVARDVVLNNIANSHTTAFRRSRVSFEDLAYQQLKLPGQQDANGKLSAVGVSVGFGVQVSGTTIDQTPGRLETSGGRLHVAIVGDGFFQVRDGSQILYSRAGAFTTNPDGEIVLSSADRGRLVEPPITIPNDTVSVTISGEGIVTVQQAGSSASTQVGQIHLARFINPDGLIAKGENLFAQSDASGSPLLGVPGKEGRGTLKQGYLETSNVNLEDELAEARRLQARLNALQQVKSILAQDSPPATSPTARIAESPSTP